ncbi:hypothetical protein MTO96_010784 [Rhipicephalus appendiculatus]
MTSGKKKGQAQPSMEPGPVTGATLDIRPPQRITSQSLLANASANSFTSRERFDVASVSPVAAMLSRRSELMGGLYESQETRSVIARYQLEQRYSHVIDLDCGAH